jgi:hypothetical protein
VFSNNSKHYLANWVSAYNEFRSLFISDFKQNLLEINGNNTLGVVVKEKDDVTLLVEFIDRSFTIRFTMVKVDDYDLRGRLDFNKVISEPYSEEILNKIYFDQVGNARAEIRNSHSFHNFKIKDNVHSIVLSWLAGYCHSSEFDA